MLKRFVVGLLIGVVMGGIAAVAVVKGLGILSFASPGLGAVMAYVAALATGALVALVAGKPIWAKGAWIEVGLKAFFGSLLAAGAMFALRKWGAVSVNLTSLGAGTGALGYLPAATLPIIATVLSVFFEVDNTEAPEEAPEKKAAPPKQARIAAGAAKGKAARPPAEEQEVEEEAALSRKARN